MKNEKSISKVSYQGILDRDNHECQFFCEEFVHSSHNYLINFFLDGNPKNLKPENLITMCIDCFDQLPKRRMNLGLFIKRLY